MLYLDFNDLTPDWHLVYINKAKNTNGLCFQKLMAQDFESAKEEMKVEWTKLARDENNRNPALLLVPRIKQEIDL